MHERGGVGLVSVTGGGSIDAVQVSHIVFKTICSSTTRGCAILASDSNEKSHLRYDRRLAAAVSTLAAIGTSNAESTMNAQHMMCASVMKKGSEPS